MKEIRKKIDEFNNDIGKIKNKLDKIMKKMENYYKLCNEIINNYNIKNRYYEMLCNIKNILINEEIIEDINEVIKENSILKNLGI